MGRKDFLPDTSGGCGCNVRHADIRTETLQGRVFDPQEIEQLRAIIRAHPQASRQQLSYRVCEELDWRKADGGPKDMSCRVALLRLHR